MNPRNDLWERWALGWRLLALLTLLVVGVTVARDAPPEWRNATRFWALLAGFAAWYGASIAVGRDRLYRSIAFCSPTSLPPGSSGRCWTCIPFPTLSRPSCFSIHLLDAPHPPAMPSRWC